MATSRKTKEALEILSTKTFTNPDFKIVVEAKLEEDFSFIDDTKFMFIDTSDEEYKSQ